MELLAPDAKLRRDELSAAGYCINGKLHGPPVAPKKRCAWCIRVHRVGVEKALEEAGVNADAPQPPPRYVLRLRASR